MIEILKPQPEYALLDSGDGEKLERYGAYILRRPDPQALWVKSNPKIWNDAHATFTRNGTQGKWIFKEGTPKDWNITFSNLSFKVKPTPFKHTGIFPEQASNWEWMRKFIASAPKPAKVLNLFAYTGGASLAAAQAGAEVAHVDGSKAAITWAKENAELSKLADKPIRWLLDDAREFVQKEIRRGNRYEGIIMDPPAFGHGANEELWKIEDHFISLVEDCKKLLSDKPLFFLINGYAAGYSAIAYKNNLQSLVETKGGSIITGELTIEEEIGKRLLPCGIFARWSHES